MFDFLKVYWREILEVLAIIVSIVICCIKKKPVQVVDTLKEVVCRLLPYCINQAECSGESDKKRKCLLILELTLESLGYQINSDLMSFAAEQVEIILSTPQKKGVMYEK